MDGMKGGGGMLTARFQPSGKGNQKVQWSQNKATDKVKMEEKGKQWNTPFRHSRDNLAAAKPWGHSFTNGLPEDEC